MDYRENNNPENKQWSPSSLREGNILRRIEDEIDLRLQLIRIVKNWPWLLISVFAAMAVGTVLTKTIHPTYKTQATLLIEDSRRKTSLDLFETFLSSYYNAQLDFYNKNEIFKSRTLSREVVLKGDFWVTYKEDGFWFNREIFGYELPFVVIPDTSKVQITDTEIPIKIIDENSFEILEHKPGNAAVLVFRGDTAMVAKNINAPKGLFKFGENIESEYCSFRVQKGRSGRVPGNKYYIQFKTVDQLVTEFKPNLDIQPSSKGSSVFELNHKGQNIEKSKTFLRRFMDQTIQFTLQERVIITNKTIDFIDEQIGFVYDSLNLVENDFEKYKSNNQIIEISKYGEDLLEKFNQVGEEKIKEQILLNYLDYLENYIIKQNQIDAIVAPSVGELNEPILTETLKKLNDLATERKLLQQNFSDKYPEIKRIEERIGQAKMILQEGIKQARENVKQRIVNINSRIAKLEESLRGIPSAERKYLNIQRKYVINENIYNYLLEKRAEAGIAKASTVSEISLLDDPEYSELLSPKANLTFSVSLLIGLLIPIIIIFLDNLFSNRIKDISIIPDFTSIPVLGTTGHNEFDRTTVVLDKPKSSVSESFRNVRSNILYFTKGKEKAVIAVTSTVPEEGKTFCSISIASVIALSGKKTILVGMDLRKPKIADDFGLENDRGVSSVLIGKHSLSEAIYKGPHENLDILLSGPIPPNPGELILSEEYLKLIEDLKNLYDYIIIDTSPIGLVSDALDLMKDTDLNLFILRHNFSKKQYLGYINHIYNQGLIPKIALLVNDYVHSEGAGYGYNYNYGYVYAYDYGQGSKDYGYHEKINLSWKKRLKNLFRLK